MRNPGLNSTPSQFCVTSEDQERVGSAGGCLPMGTPVHGAAGGEGPRGKLWWSLKEQWLEHLAGRGGESGCTWHGALLKNCTEG